MSTTTYVFKGLRPYMEEVCRAKGRDLHQLGRAVELWHAKQVQNSLGQLPRLDRESQVQLLAHACYVREGLACALEGIDAALLDVVLELDLPIPPFLDDPVPIGPHAPPNPEK